MSTPALSSCLTADSAASWVSKTATTELLALSGEVAWLIIVVLLTGSIDRPASRRTTDPSQHRVTVGPSERNWFHPAIDRPRPAPCVTMGRTVTSRESPLTRGTTQDLQGEAAAFESMLATVLPEAAERSLAALARQATIRPFRRHERVLSQSRDPLLTLIVDGHLGAVRSDADGRQQMITIAGPGELVGVLSLRPDAPAVDLVGLNRGTAALWSGDLVMSLARLDAGLAVGLLDHALRSAARLLNRLEHVTFDSVSRRLAMILWMRRELLFDARRPLLSRPQLADLAGTSREMAGRVIRDFEQRGLVGRIGVTGLVLLDPVGLRAAAGIDASDGHDPGLQP